MIFDELMRSSTRLYACPRSLDQPDKRARIEHFRALVRSVLDARKRVMLEVNVPPTGWRRSWRCCPACASRPSRRCTTMRVRGEGRRAARRPAELIRGIKERGGTDIVVFAIAQIVP